MAHCIRTFGLVLAMTWSPGSWARSQAFEISAGSSTMYDATGGSVSFHGETTDWTLGAGVQQGRFAAGGAMQVRTHQGLATAGLQQLRADLPTDIFDTTHRLMGVGLGFTTPASVETTANAFAGVSSAEGGSPLFRSGDLEQRLFYAQLGRSVFRKCRLGVLGTYLKHTLAIGSIECPVPTNSRLVLAASAGAGSSGQYAAASLRYTGDRLQARAAYFRIDGEIERNTMSYGPVPEPAGTNASFEYKLTRAWTLSAAHQHFVTSAFPDADTPALAIPREKTALNEVGVAYSSHVGLFSVTALSSSLQSASSAWGVTLSPTQFSNLSMTGFFGRSFGRLRWTEGVFTSEPSSSPRSTILLSGVGFRMNPHLLFTETINTTKGTATFSHGGEIIAGSTRLGVNYELVYLANRPSQPLQQLTLVSAETHLWHLLSVQVATDIDPMGKAQYTFRLGTAGARARSGTGESALGLSVGKSLLTGQVVDDHGNAVSGAALAIDTSFVYTDSHGLFSYREKRNARHRLRVLTEEFLEPGLFEVASAPDTVVSARQPEGALPVRIVVRHRLALEADGSAPSSPVLPYSAP